MSTIYVAGPMTGYPEFNYPAFREASRTLASWTSGPSPAGHQAHRRVDRGCGVAVVTDPHIWPPSPHLDAWAMRVRLLALVRRHEVKQGWVPCRLIRKVAGL